MGKVVHTVKRAGTYAAKVSHKELHKIAVHVGAVGGLTTSTYGTYLRHTLKNRKCGGVQTFFAVY